jgi:hypothetical protein
MWGALRKTDAQRDSELVWEDPEKVFLNCPGDSNIQPRLRINVSDIK